MRSWVRERDKVGNARKSTTLKGGGGKAKGGVSADEVSLMSPEEKMIWAQNASDEDFETVFDDLHKTK